MLRAYTTPTRCAAYLCFYFLVVMQASFVAALRRQCVRQAGSDWTLCWGVPLAAADARPLSRRAQHDDHKTTPPAAVAMGATLPAGSKEIIDRIFAIIDADRNGKLDLAELTELLKRQASPRNAGCRPYIRGDLMRAGGGRAQAMFNNTYADGKAIEVSTAAGRSAARGESASDERCPIRWPPSSSSVRST